MASRFEDLKVSDGGERNFKCKWTIPCFSSLDSRVGKHHKSEVFKVEENGSEWFLGTYPGGDTEESKGFVICFLFVNNKPEGIKCKYGFSICNTNDEVLFTKKSDEWVVNQGYCFPKRISRSDLKSKLINDVLIIAVDVTYCVSVEDMGSIYHGAGIVSMTKLAEDLKSFWISKKHSDLTLSVGEKDLPVHSVVLCARSKVFSAMFEHDTVEKTTRIVEVTDFESDVMESFMEYVYSGVVKEMNFNLALELLRASDKYEVSDLKMYCYHYLKSLFNSQNIYQVLLSADIYNAEELRGHAIEYFCKNLSMENFKSERSNLETRPQLLGDIIEKMIEKCTS